MDTNDLQQMQTQWQKPPQSPAKLGWVAKWFSDRTKLILNTLGGVTGIVVGIGFAILDPRPVIIAMAIMVTAVISTLCGMEWWLRVRLWRAMKEDTLAFIEGLRLRNAVEQRVLHYNNIGTRLVAISMLFWVPWKLWADASGYRHEPWRAVVGVGGIVGLLLAGSWWSRRKHRKLLQEEAMINMLLDEFSLEAAEQPQVEE